MTDGIKTVGEYKCATCGEMLNMIGIIQHECERVLSPETLNPSEQETLLYIELCLVDHEGKLDSAKMNYRDDQNLKLFAAAGLLHTEPIPFDEVDPAEHQKRTGAETRRVSCFTDRAFELAMACRQARAKRMIEYDVDWEGDSI